MEEPSVSLKTTNDELIRSHDGPPNTTAVTLLGNATQSKTFQVVVALQPLLRLMRPGDYLTSNFSHDVMRIILAAGAKMKSIMDVMERTESCLSNSASEVELVQWFLHACQAAKYNKAAMTSHGQIPHHTGPTAFAKSLGIIKVANADAEGSHNFRLYGVNGRYEVVDTSGRILHNIRKAIAAAWPAGVPVAFTKATDLVAFQGILGNILNAHLLHAKDYVGKQLARKVCEVMDQTTPDSWDSLTVRDIVKVSPDKNTHLHKWDLDAPASSLHPITQNRPLQATLYLCWAHGKTLRDRTPLTSEWVTAHMLELQEALRKYCSKNGFSPCPIELIRLTEQQAAPNQSTVLYQPAKVETRGRKRSLVDRTTTEAFPKDAATRAVASCAKRRHRRQCTDIIEVISVD